MNIFAQMVRDIEEDKAGRIHRVPGHWLLCPDEEREPGNYPIPGKEKAVAYLDRVVHISVDRQGRKMRLTRKTSCLCPNPEYAEQFAAIQSEGRPLKLSVPESFCRKCVHYRSARRSRRRYATCGFKAVKNPKLETAKTFCGMLTEAKKKASELMGES